MKIYKWEKIQGLQRMILFIELFANIKRFIFQTFIRAYEFLNETKRWQDFKLSISVGGVLFQICVIQLVFEDIF